MEDCINCNCIEVYEAPEGSLKHLLSKITAFLANFAIEGAEDMSKIK